MRICCTFLGSHGASLAACAVATSLWSLVLLPSDAPFSVFAEVQRSKGDAVIVDPVTRGSAVGLLECLFREHGWLISNRDTQLVTGKRFGNPSGFEEYKTIVCEIWSQLGGHLAD
jgi:hypothetical protein